MASQFKSQDQDPLKKLSTPDISQLFLPRLGSNRMESLQNLHTHAVDSAIQLQGNNRVLKKRPPPISDEEAETKSKTTMYSLTTTVRTLPSLLQDYKHRVFGEPSDICTDCGASPQDVRHLFRLHHTPD